MSLTFAQPEMRNLGRILQAYAEHSPDKIYLMADERRLSFSDTNRLVNRFAAGLKALGIGHGDRVAMYMQPALNFVALALAVNKLGAIWTPLNTDYKGEWLRDAIADSKPKVVITDTASLANILAAEQLTPRSYRLVCDGQIDNGDHRAKDIVALGDFLTLSDADHDLSAIHYGDTAAILWTSGTTGKPKGVMQSHNAWVRSCESGNRMSETRADDIAYNCLPLYNSAAWVSNIFRALVAGIPCAIDPQFSVGSFWDRIRFYGATQTLTLGAMHMFLWNAPARPNDIDNKLRVAYMIPMPDAIMEPFCKRFGIEKILQGYGQSEMMAFVVRANKADSKWKPNALGTVLGDLELKLLNDDGIEVGAGEPGEFCVKPLQPHVIFNGYFDQPEATANAYYGGLVPHRRSRYQRCGRRFIFCRSQKRCDSLQRPQHLFAASRRHRAAPSRRGGCCCLRHNLRRIGLGARNKTRRDIKGRPSVERRRLGAVYQRQCALLSGAALYRIRRPTTVHTDQQNRKI